MRITGGELRSRRVAGPARGMAVRPTPDAMRERVYNVLGDKVAGRRMLDLYAGTGIVGCEALSRGAAAVVFVEQQRRVARLLAANLAALGLDHGRTRLMITPARTAVSRLTAAGEVFDLAWADPPFENWADAAVVLAEAFGHGVLTADAIALLECPARADLTATDLGLTVVRDLAGGASRVLIVRPAVPPNET